jgi:hypothetical protein
MYHICAGPSILPCCYAEAYGCVPMHVLLRAGPLPALCLGLRGALPLRRSRRAAAMQPARRLPLRPRVQSAPGLRPAHVRPSLP